MTGNRITCEAPTRGAPRPRRLAPRRRLRACGGGGGGARHGESDKAADAEILNDVLARELATVGAYDRTCSLPRRGGPRQRPRIPRPGTGTRRRDRQSAARPRQGEGRKAEEAKRSTTARASKTQADDFLAFLYEVESVSIAGDLRAISHLTAPWPRSLLGSIAANQAQHLVLLRQALGADAAESIPGAFEDGTTAAGRRAP